MTTEQKTTMEAFQEGSRRYLAVTDSSTMTLWSAGLVSPVDVNHANQEELQTLSGIGPVLAKKIVDYREKNGYFRTVQDLAKVNGIGPKLLLRWEGLITVMTDTIMKKGTRIE